MGPNFQGIVTTDRYNAYARIPAERHQLCWAHFRREFKALSQLAGEIGETGTKLFELSNQMFSAWHNAHSGQTARLLFQKQAVAIQAEIIEQMSKHGLNGPMGINPDA
jgi:hypothetical protein